MISLFRENQFRLKMMGLKETSVGESARSLSLLASDSVVKRFLPLCVSPSLLPDSLDLQRRRSLSHEDNSRRSSRFRAAFLSCGKPRVNTLGRHLLQEGEPRESAWEGRILITWQTSKQERKPSLLDYSTVCAGLAGGCRVCKGASEGEMDKPRGPFI